MNSDGIHQSDPSNPHSDPFQLYQQLVRDNLIEDPAFLSDLMVGSESAATTQGFGPFYTELGMQGETPSANTPNPQMPATYAGEAPSPNSNYWLGNPNMAVAFAVNLMEAFRTMKYAKLVEMEFKIEGLEMMTHLALEIADLTLESAKLEADRIRVQAFSAIMQGVVSGVMGVAGMAAGFGAFGKTGGTLVTGQVLSMISQSVNHLVDGASKLLEAGLVEDKGMVDSLIKILENMKEIATRGEDWASESFRELAQEMIKILDQLKSMHQEQYSSHGRT